MQCLVSCHRYRQGTSPTYLRTSSSPPHLTDTHTLNRSTEESKERMASSEMLDEFDKHGVPMLLLLSCKQLL